jgi:hypothetical protein
MTCSACGTPLEFGVLVCPNCGASTRDAAGKERPVGEILPPIEGSPIGLQRRRSTTAVVSMVCGIASWLVAPCVGGLAAVVLGHLARREIRQSQGRVDGDGFAVAGLILGYLHLVAACFAFWLVAFIWGGLAAFLAHVAPNAM